MKPKKGLINSMHNSPLKIPEKFKTKNETIQDTIEKLSTECYIEEQQKLIKLLPKYLVNSEDSEFVTSLLTYLFITIDNKHPIRKTISRLLLTANNELIKKSLSGNILYLIKMVENGTEYTYARRYEVIINLQNCFNNFPLGVESISYITDDVTLYVIDFFIRLVDLLSDDQKENIKKSEVHLYIYNVTKLLVSILQQCILSKILPEYSTKLMITSYKVIMDDYISFDTKCNCGLLMVVSVIHIPDHITNDCKFKTNPCLSLLKFDKSEDGNQGFFNFNDLTKNYTANLCVYSGILNVVPQNILCEEIIDGVPVISFMFGKLLECAKRCTGKPTQILEVSRALILISKIMNTIPLSYVEPMFSQGLDYVWTHLDHFVDTVKHSAKTIFENLIKLAYRHYKDGYTALLKMILTNMIDLLVNRCTHYVALTILSAETGCSFLLEQFSHLPFILLINISDSSVAPQICNTYESLMAQHAKEEQNIDKWLELWVDLVKPLLTRSVAPVTISYQRLLISAYKIQPLVLKSIMHYQWYSGANELGALLGCLRVARKSGLSVPMENNNDLTSVEKKKKYWRGYIEFEFLESMMCHQSDEVRVSVLALIVESQKSTEIFTTWELNFLKKYFFYNVTTQMPNTRQQIISLYKKALIRIKEGLVVLIRHGTMMCNKIKAEGDTTKKCDFEELQLYKKQEVSYKVFTENFFQEYLCNGFYAGSNYQRRATCLELTLFMLTENCIETEELIKNWKAADTLALLKLLCDSYESNISMAFQIIKKLPISVFGHFQSREVMKCNIHNTIALASGIKPTSVTAAGYILQVHLMSPYAKELISEILQNKVDFNDTYVLTVSLFIHLIEAGLKLANKSLLAAVKRTPVYGHILCIRHLIEKEDFSNCDYWEYLITKLVSICNDVSQIVSPIVNNSSPEGYIPMDAELIGNKEANESVTSQMVLVYAWRTAKEISLLLGELTLKAPDVDPKTGKELLTNEIMSHISEHFLNLFLETKHRGAYEQAYLGFCRFCEKLWRSPNEDFKSWPKIWLINILKVLKGENENTFHKLCPTRRSAGLPFMIQAIVITEPRHTNNENFHLCMRSLLNIAANAEEENIKSKIHAMNILRSLYRNNHLGELVTPYISQGVITALNAFDHDIWGVRNSATLMFATLVVRIFGVQRTRDMDELSLKNRMSARVFFMRYSELYDFLLQQLIKGTAHDDDTTALHPVLLILERLYPCNTEEESQLGKYIPYVTKCLHNSMYKIRALAAQASTSLIPNLEVVGYIKKILILLSNVTLSDNYCQGLIMQLMCLLRSLTKGYTPLNVPDMIEATFWIFISVGKYISHYTAATYFDMVVSLSSVFLKNCQGALIFHKLVEILIWQSVKDSGTTKVLSTARKKFNLSRFNLHMHIVSNLYHCDSYFKSLYIKELVLSGLYSAYEEINQYCLNFINYLYFDHPKYVKHSLYVTEQLEISEKEYKLVTSLDIAVKEYVIESIHKDLERKLFPVFYDILGKSKECCLCMFLVLQHYPCILNNIKAYKSEVLDFLMNWCRCDDDEMFCASLSVITTFLTSLSDSDIRQLNFSALLKVIMEAASPISALHQRISVAQFLVTNKRLFCEKDFFIDVEDLSELWNVVITLLEDDDQLVRDTISQLSTKDSKQIPLRSDSEFPVIAERAREDLLGICVDVLPTKTSVPLLLSWALRRAPDDDKDAVELFEKGEMNTFAEEEQLAKLATTHLKKLLWKLDDGLNYNDHSIFIEEHTLIVATIIYNTLYQNLPTPVNTNVRIALLCIIKKILDFLEKCQINKHDFQLELETIILKEFLSMSMKGTHGNSSRLKFILKCVFNIEHGWSH